MNGSDPNSPDPNESGPDAPTPNESDPDLAYDGNDPDLAYDGNDPDLAYDESDPDLAYDESASEWRVRYDPATTSTTYAALASVARLAGTEATDLPVFADAVDPDALDRLAASFEAGESSGSWRIEFRYADYVLVVDGPASLLIREATGASGPG